MVWCGKVVGKSPSKMEILNMNSHELIKKQIHNHKVTVRSVKRKNIKQQNFLIKTSNNNSSANSAASSDSGCKNYNEKNNHLKIENQLHEICGDCVVYNYNKINFTSDSDSNADNNYYYDEHKLESDSDPGFGGGGGGSNLKLNSVKVQKTKMSMVWNTSGWIRVYCGPDRNEIACDDPSRMVHVVSSTNVKDIVHDMDLPDEYTLWIQIGGMTSRRLFHNEHPFQIQEEFLKKMGVHDESRRSRLCIDPDLKHLIRFYIGPSETSFYDGIKKSGFVEILKGLVFPQWRRRGICIMGSKLYVMPANTNLQPEIFELSSADIYEHTPNYNRLILKIVPKQSCLSSVYNLTDSSNLLISSNSDDCVNGKYIKNINSNNNNNNYSYNNNISNSSNSVNSQCERDKVLFLGFEESWERDLWSKWLLEATTDTTDTKRLDICGSGLQAFPEIILQSNQTVEELLAGQNKLQEIALNALTDFPNLKILRLPGNQFKEFPKNLLGLTGLKILDLCDNNIAVLPYEICQLENLEELCLDRNELTELQNSIKNLKSLKILHVAYNKLEKLPSFLLSVKNMGLVDMYSQKLDFNHSNNLNKQKSSENSNYKTNINGSNSTSNPPISKINLRSNHLKGSIILGNYGFLTQLDVSENMIEILDLSALDKLESLQCSRNKLVELTVNGRCLTSLIAGNNCLKKLTVHPTPINLRHLDVSYNELVELPDWLNGCYQLRTLFGNNNKLRNLPEHLFCSEHNSLHTLQLGYNKLKLLPIMPHRKLHIQELFLQNNEIIEMPENFFFACRNLILLNLSSNKLQSLPVILMENNNYENFYQLEKLFLTNNQLSDRIYDIACCFKNLRIFHLGYNRLATFPELCLANWPELEELVLSGNRLQHLPENLANLKHLKILRVHSNQLQTVPILAKTLTLRVLDLAHNQLDKINLVNLVPKKLQFLDLSCNRELQVDPNQLQVCRSQRRMSLIDVSGKNRASLPSTPSSYQEFTDLEPPWTVGFSETPGNLSKLYITQLRLPTFCNTESLFGMFDGELNNVVPNILVKVIPKILLEERTVKETANDYMKYTLLSAHRELKQYGQKNGVCATLCHISRSKGNNEFIGYFPNGGSSPNQNGGGGRKFILRVASVGEASAYLVRATGSVKLTPSTPNRKIGNSSEYPLIIPDPEICEITLCEQDEYLIIGNKKLWEVIGVESMVGEIRKEENVILAAKRIQDIAQSYGAEENLSIIIVKLNNLSSDVDFLVRELRHTIKKKPNSTILSGFCKCGCCCESNNSCCHSGAAAQFIRQPSGRSDRSSPSGQSDQTANELQAQLNKQRFIDTSTIGSRRSQTNYASNERKSLRGGVVRAVRAKIEEEREKEKEAESDSALSEEQFKCWEYMLEQNTQLLFDKELNTISKAFTKKAPGINTHLAVQNMQGSKTNLTKSQLKALSSSSPQLAYNGSENGGIKPVSTQYSAHRNNGSIPFLSRHFGSARSFNPHSNSLFKPIRLNNSNRFNHSGTSINTGPNAAYFGSLQRLMPYNLEYDFAVMHERNIEDSLDPDNRMHQYWGIATTEL